MTQFTNSLVHKSVQFAKIYFVSLFHSLIFQLDLHTLTICSSKIISFSFFIYSDDNTKKQSMTSRKFIEGLGGRTHGTNQTNSFIRGY